MLRTQLTRSLSLVPIVFSLMLTACGGGGNDGGNGGAAPAAVPVVPPTSTAPTITTQPTNTSVTLGASAMFSVAISGGTAPITYQWKRNGAVITGATSDRYILATTVFGDNAATFSVDIINAAGTLSSSTAVLTVTPINGYIVNTSADLVDDNFNDAVCHTSANTCSLRAAIMQANHVTQAGTQTIYVPAGVYTLTRAKSGTNGEDTGDLNLTTPLAANQIIAIVGASAATTIIDANQLDGVFKIDISRVVTINDITIRNGNRVAPSASGGGIANLGTLTITNSIVENNRTAANGGGIMSDKIAALVINGCTIRSNIAIAGGGVYTSGASIIHNSMIDANSAQAGGGIASTGSVSITNTTIKLNTATDSGGGLFASGTSTTIRNSTLNSNSASDGGGIFNTSDQLNIVNSTLTGNWANTHGGGLYNRLSAAIYNTSIVYNDADHDRDINGGIGGGIYFSTEVDPYYGARLIVVNSLIAGNTLNNAPIDNNCNGTLEVYGWNLLGDMAGCAFIGNGTSSRGTIASNTIDGVLRNNGGPTLTHTLLAGSVAIDSSNALLGCVDETGAALTTDQRGAPRVAGARCDVGAVEYGSVVPQ